MLILSGVDVNGKSFTRYGNSLLIEIRFREKESFYSIRWNSITLRMSTWKFRRSFVSPRKSRIDYCWSPRYANTSFILTIELSVGWTPVHHAAYCDHVPILRLLHNKHPELLEQMTEDKWTFPCRSKQHERSFSLAILAASPPHCFCHRHPVH